MRGAIRLLNDYFIPTAKRVFVELDQSKVDTRASVLIKWLRKMGADIFNAKATRRQIGGTLREAKDMDEACKLLESNGLIRLEPTAHATHRGRQPINYEVNPLVFR